MGAKKGSSHEEGGASGRFCRELLYFPVLVPHVSCVVADDAVYIALEIISVVSALLTCLVRAYSSRVVA